MTTQTIHGDAAVPPRVDLRQALDFETLMGRDGWWRLAPDIRRRFREKPEAGAPIRYNGVMQHVRCSWIGLALAQFCRLLGTPFAPYRGADVPLTIELRHDAQGGVVWDRCYHYAGRAPVSVSSVKRTGADGELVECVGFGFGMRLAVFEANRALHFLSLHYFWKFGRWQLRLPQLLTPGTAHVIHEDVGAGSFRFSMTIHHPLLGTLFQQDGVFHETGAQA